MLKFAQTVVITLGAEGALISAHGFATEVIPAPKVSSVIDTNGAGDSFAGAFLYGIAAGHDLPTAARLAVNVASKLVQHNGPRLDKATYLDQLRSIWRAFLIKALQSFRPSKNPPSRRVVNLCSLVFLQRRDTHEVTDR